MAATDRVKCLQPNSKANSAFDIENYILVCAADDGTWKNNIFLYQYANNTKKCLESLLSNEMH